MEFHKLGKTGLNISEIGLGGTEFGRSIGEKESIALIHQAFDAGINFIDTADFYVDGHSEEIIGKAIKGKRPSVIVATKFSNPTGPGPNEKGASRYHIIEAVEASLKRLDTEYIDLYYVHQPDATTPIEETLRTLDNLIKAGKVRYIGCSNFVAWQLCEALWTSRIHNLESFAVIQSHYNLIERKIEQELVPCCENYGIGIIPYFPLAGGFLTGKYKRGKPAPAGSRLWTIQNLPAPPVPNRPHSLGGLPMFGTVLNDSYFEQLARWQKFAKSHNNSVEELAIAWLLSHSYVDSVIVGATKPEQLSSDITAVNWKLSTQDLTELEKLTEGN